MSQIAWRAEYLLPVLLLSIPVLFFPISYYVPRAFRPLLARRGLAGRELEIWTVVLERIFGAVVLGLPALLAALLFLPPSDNRYGFNFDHLGLSLTATALGWAMVWLVLTYTARAWPAGFKGYPQMRVRCWDTRLLILNTASWCVYLVVHEFLFRGVLLFSLTDIYGAWPAVLITTGLHSFKHLMREPQEQLITIWVGIWFGAVTLITGSLVAPILTHCFTASFMDVAAIRTVPGGEIRERCPDTAA